MGADPPRRPAAGDPAPPGPPGAAPRGPAPRGPAPRDPTPRHPPGDAAGQGSATGDVTGDRPGALDIDVRLRLGPRTLTLALWSRAAAIGIVGPSGAGKSTLLRIVAGLEDRAEGRVALGGSAWQGPGTFVPAWQRRVGWVPQDALLFPHLTVRANLAYAARTDPTPLAATLEVGHLLDRYPRHLSGGERQRVALGRALATDPRLLLLDEPFSALDRPLRARIAPALSAWMATGDRRMLLVSHDAADVAALVDEVWEFREARLVRV
jgi:molybdate transport system ATP-binding protein